MNKFDALKGDDHGDDGQNEESSLQEVGEEEKWNETKVRAGARRRLSSLDQQSTPCSATTPSGTLG